MSGDFSRKTFDPKKHYSGVLMQQGRVQLDADWNEQLEIQQHRTETQAKDVIGTCGVPKKGDGFEISTTPDGGDLTISPGRIYVDGILCELEATPVPITFVPNESEEELKKVAVPFIMVDNRELEVGQWVEISNKQDKKLLKIIDLNKETRVLTFDTDIKDFQNTGTVVIRRITTFLNQPYYPHPDYPSFITSPPTSPPLSPPASPPESPPASPPLSPPIGLEYLSLKDGMYLVFLDVWQREINFLDDSLIHEVALGEADTTTRIQNIWQVKLLQVSSGIGGEVTCKTQFTEWDNYTAPNTGMLNAQTKVTEDQKKPCLLPPISGYRRLENQLYRVEIHTGGTRDKATFKWSRNNASVEAKIEKIDGNIVTVSDIGKDKVLGFAGGQWVEIVDDESTLKGTPNQLVQIDKINSEMREITMKTPVAEFNNKPNLKLRKWDQTGTTASADGVAMTADWIELEEDGIEVRFSDGSYCPGDYWLIPARTATGEIEWPPYEIPNTNPIPQPPVGIRHHYCRLALIEAYGGFITLKDCCRNLFPTLTEICAEDVCFDNSICELPDTETVQDALNLLCDVRDLRHHNKHLHGHGVVCGLKVKCGPRPEQVVVENGYALDCEGNGIHVNEENEEKGIVYNVVAGAENKELLSNGDCTVCLTIDSSGSEGAIISVESYDQQDFWDGVLEGTLLKDFYEECIESLIKFLKEQFLTELTDEPPVPNTQRRLTAFINLLAQLVNSESGPYAFLSGEQKTTARDEDCGGNGDKKRFEDLLLWCFYEDLKERIASETFCAMFEGDRPFPPYNIDPGLETIFGPTLKFHRRLKLHPSRSFAYTCGTGNKIYVYDLTTNELVQTLVFPASKNIHVQDVVISQERSELYAVGILDDKDSVFATAKIKSDGIHAWRKSTSVECGSKYVRLAIDSAPTNKLYAISKAKGLYSIDGIGLPGFSTSPVREFNATGLLELSEDGTRAFAAEASGTTESYNFAQILDIDLTGSTAGDRTYVISGSDIENDIFFYNHVVYVTGDPYIPSPGPVHTKSLYGHDITNGAQAFTPVDLFEDTFTRLAVAPTTGAGDFLLVIIGDRFKVVRIDLSNHTLDADFRIPVQIFPMDIAVSADGRAGYVLNSIVNTLTAIDISMVFDSASPPNFVKEPPTDISEYRQDVINAFTDLISHFNQYLKDCFCDKFLIDCPECAEDDKVYLGTVEIRDRKVYNICNFTKRHYVKSSHTWSYWLSTIPILPLIKRVFTEFCCKVFEPIRMTE